MNGAESLARTLVAGGVEVCLANPGTSEMHFVAALDKVDGIRCVLTLFEGVATGAADGYYRIAGKPAATLLHLGPGLANGLSNLHNAKKARSGIVNIVGDHAGYHLAYDAPLTADVEGIARPMSHWVRTSPTAKAIAGDGAQAIRAARNAPGHVATLILPADTAWGEADGIAGTPAPEKRKEVSEEAIEAVARILTGGEKSTILLGGAAMMEGALLLAGRVAAKTGCRLIGEPQYARLQRGRGRVAVERFPYVVSQALEVTKDVDNLILVGSKSPVAFFAYPDQPSSLVSKSCRVVKLADPVEDIELALHALAERIGALSTAPAYFVETKENTDVLPSGPMDVPGMARILGRLIPENAIVVDDSNTVGRPIFQASVDAAQHDWLSLMGGAIGWGISAAVGAALAAPNRKVVALEGDGSGMYAPAALWTMAREKLDIVVLVFANRAYQILHGELAKVGAKNVGPKALDMLRLDRPTLNWVDLARAQGLEAGRAVDLDSFKAELERGIAAKGPYLIEVVL